MSKDGYYPLPRCKDCGKTLNSCGCLGREMRRAKENFIEEVMEATRKYDVAMHRAEENERIENRYTGPRNPRSKK